MFGDGAEKPTPTSSPITPTLVATLRKQVEIERENETLRRRLALHPTFDLAEAFAFLDAEGRGFVTLDALRRAFARAGVDLTHAEQLAVLRMFDVDHHGRITYADFVRRMMPRSEAYSELVAARAARANRSSSLSSSSSASSSSPSSHRRTLSLGAQAEFAAAIRHQVQLERELDDLRRALTSQPEFSLHEAVRALDCSAKASADRGAGALGASDLRRFLATHDIPASDDEVSALVARYDKHRRGHITYADFLEELVLPSTGLGV